MNTNWTSITPIRKGLFARYQADEEALVINSVLGHYRDPWNRAFSADGRLETRSSGPFPCILPRNRKGYRFYSVSPAGVMVELVIIGGIRKTEPYNEC